MSNYFNEITMSAFTDEFSKLGGIESAAMKAGLDMFGSWGSKALSWARKSHTGGIPSLLEGVHIRKSLGKDIGGLADNIIDAPANRNLFQKAVQAPRNMISNAVLNVDSILRDPMSVLKSQGTSFTHKMKDGAAVTRDYGANWEGVKDYTHALAKPVMGAGLVGGAGIYTMNRLGGESQSKSVGDAALWTLAPGVAMTRDIGSMGLKMYKAKTQKTLPEGQQVPGAPQSF